MNFYFFVLFFALIFPLTLSLSQKWWEQFKDKFMKRYRDKKEELYRNEIFKRQYRIVEEHNELHRKGHTTYMKGINQFSDLTEEEAIRRMGLMRLNITAELMKTRKYAHDEGENRQLTNRSYYNLPYEVDWSKRGAVTGIKYQSQCGSCWAFAVIGTIESQWFIKTGELQALSEQNLLDCVKTDSDPCYGVPPSDAYEYIIENRGVDTEESYPYEGRRSQCRYNSAKKGAYISSAPWADPYGDEDALKYTVATVGPVSIIINWKPSLAAYAKGLYYDRNCNVETNNMKYHAMVIVGYGTENGQDFWLVKNSWGKHWGENGYVKMARNRNNHCRIADFAAYPIIDV